MPGRFVQADQCLAVTAFRLDFFHLIRPRTGTEGLVWKKSKVKSRTGL